MTVTHIPYYSESGRVASWWRAYLFATHQTTRQCPPTSLRWIHDNATTAVIILRITHVHLNGFQNEELGRHRYILQMNVVTFIFGIRHDEHELFSK